MALLPAVTWLGRGAFALGFAGSALVTWVPASYGQESVPLRAVETAKISLQPLPVPAETTAVKKMTLGECLALADVSHPSIRMAEASLSSAMKGMTTLEKLPPRLGALVRPDLPFRKEQSRRGIDATAANVALTRQLVANDVTRMYYTFVFAKQQEVIVNEIVEQLNTYLDVVREILKQPPNPNDNKLKISKLTENVIIDALKQAEAKRVFARTGCLRAVAALKQAMGVDPVLCEFEPKDTELPIMAGTVTQAQIVDFALSRRPELAQSAAATDIFRLEVCAQAALKTGFQQQTFAAGADLHAIQVPAAIRNGDYKPGATPPEMPANLFGSSTDRASRATDLSRRQDAQYEQVRGLVQLEAINAYLTWKQTADQLALGKQRFDAGRQLADLTRQNTGNVTQMELVQNFVQAGLAQSNYLDAVYEHVKSMIALERVTAGAVRAGFPGR
jgi:hypothetical protein